MNYKYNNGGFADLHNHTTASDGLLSPTKLVEYAYLNKLKCLAITDHDTTAGIREGIEAGRSKGIEVIPGIEINTQLNDIEVHMLGYYIDYEAKWFNELLSEIRDARENRARKIIANLNRMYNLDIDYSEVVQEAGEAAIARPHIARVLIRHGYAADMTDAFTNYLGTDNPAYVNRYRLTPKEGIDVIKHAGGVACIAHPALVNNDAYIENIITEGVDGLEVYHSKHTPKQTEAMKAIAFKHHLLITGGSDCHGELYDGMPIIGDVSIGEDEVLQIKAIVKK